MAAGRFRVIAETSEDTRTVEAAASGQVSVEGHQTAFSVSTIGQGEFDISDGERHRRAFAVIGNDVREVFIDGRVWRFEVENASERKRRAASHHGDQVAAPMPGTVVKLLVEKGQQVQRGDVLLKLEAMKMELPIRAPHDGAVTAIHCREGELVQAGVRLLDLS